MFRFHACGCIFYLLFVHMSTAATIIPMTKTVLRLISEYKRSPLPYETIALSDTVAHATMASQQLELQKFIINQYSVMF